MAPLRDLVPNILHFFWKGFRTRACTEIIYKLPQERLFLQRKKSEYQSSFRVRGIGAFSGTRFCMYCYQTKQNKQAKTKKNTSFVEDCQSNKAFCVFAACAKMLILCYIVIAIKDFGACCENAKCFIVITVLNKTWVFLTFCFFVLFNMVRVHAKAGP